MPPISADAMLPVPCPMHSRLLLLVVSGQIIDNLGGQQRLQQSDGSKSDGIGQNDLQGFPGHRHLRQGEYGQCRRKLTQVANRAQIHTCPDSDIVRMTIATSGEGMDLVT